MNEPESNGSDVPERRRRILRGLGIFTAFVCILLIVALIALHTPPARRYITDQVVALLAREQIEFSTDQLGFNALNASINLRNVRVRSTSWPDAPVFATIGSLRIDLGLWQLLRGRRVGGFKFRRRSLVDGYIPDFWCPEAKLVIEIDGREYAAKQVRDAERDTRFFSHGIHTVHMSSDLVWHDPTEALEIIRAALELQRGLAPGR